MFLICSPSLEEELVFFYFFNERMKEIANEVKINQEMHISATFIL